MCCGLALRASRSWPKRPSGRGAEMGAALSHICEMPGCQRFGTLQESGADSQPTLLRDRVRGSVIAPAPVRETRLADVDDSDQPAGAPELFLSGWWARHMPGERLNVIAQDGLKQLESCAYWDP